MMRILSILLVLCITQAKKGGKIDSQMFLRNEKVEVDEGIQLATVAPGGSSGTTAAPAALGPCKTCIYVLERIKQGYQYLLPSICVEIHANNQNSDDFGKCQETIANLSIMGANVKSWFINGCYKSEPYGSTELVSPCPSHVICAQLNDLSGAPFCPLPTSDFVASATTTAAPGGGGGSGV